jgi:hypothetical protein
MNIIDILVILGGLAFGLGVMAWLFFIMYTFHKEIKEKEFLEKQKKRDAFLKVCREYIRENEKLEFEDKKEEEQQEQIKETKICDRASYERVFGKLVDSKDIEVIWKEEFKEEIKRKKGSLL